MDGLSRRIAKTKMWQLAGTALMTLWAQDGLTATFRVDTTTDAVDAFPGDGACATGTGACSLRAAVQETNALPGADLIEVPRGKYDLTLRGPAEVLSATGDLNIRDVVEIRGAGPKETIIDGGVCPDPEDPGCTPDSVLSDHDRVLSVLERGFADVSGLTIQNGGGRLIDGGGIYVQGGTWLNLSRSIITENKSRQFGGGVTAGGDVRIVDSTMSDNMLPSSGGGGVTSSGGAYLFSAEARLDW